MTIADFGADSGKLSFVISCDLFNESCYGGVLEVGLYDRA